MSTLSANTIQPLSGTTVTIPSDLTVTGNILLSGSIIPNTDGVSSTSSFSLGSPTSAWKDIYVSNGTINFLDGAGNVQGTLSATANGLATDGDAYFNSIRVGQGPTTGSGNVVVGNNSFSTTSSLDRISNTSIGHSTLTSYIGGPSGTNSYNTALGAFSLESLTVGGQNTAVGMSALRQALTGLQNTAVGYHSLSNLTSGTNNVGIGVNALYDLINGYQNTSLGDASLVSITSGNNNTAIGWFAGRYASGASSGNVYLGFNAGPASNIVQNNKLYINNQYGDPLIGGDFTAQTVTISGDTFIDGKLIQGFNVTASGLYSHAEGRQNEANGDYSHAEGRQNEANGDYSHAEGYITIAQGTGSHAEGLFTSASGNYSHAEGYYTKATGQYSHAEGTETTSQGEYSHAEGENTIASGSYSHAEGQGSIASGLYSHAEGNQTTASGQYSHAEGAGTIALGNSSHAGGRGTIASGSYQHAIGFYNTQGDTTSLFIVGNGQINDRKDAFKVSANSSIIIPQTQSSAPAWTGTDGEIIPATVGGQYLLYMWMNGAWRSGSFV
jgi:trimeric autotransporter adhesin